MGKKRRRRRLHSFTPVRGTWMSSGFNCGRCEVNDNLFCMSVADSGSGPSGSLSQTLPQSTAKNPAGRRESPPTGTPADKSGWNKERRRPSACGPSSRLQPHTLHSAASSFVTQKKKIKKKKKSLQLS